ncbi:Chaperone, heat shock 33 family protein [gamma proteobacterium HdN1]|nr:Chaperone, heat shock 33 family protein [gamma proteobacterium HdN1]
MQPPTFADTDTCQRFLIEDSNVRGEIVLLEHSLQAVFAKYDYPIEIQQLLGELLAAAVLLASTVKIDGSLILQARGGAPIDLLMVECDNERNVRALARWSGNTSGLGFSELLAGSQLVITLDPRTGERYQGIVPLEGRNLSESLEFYFQQSEQIATRLWLVQGSGRAAGMILQQLPFNTEQQRSHEQNEEDWQRLTTLAHTITPDEQLHLPPQSLLQRLFHEEDVRIFQPHEIQFHCSCSQARVGAALANLGRSTLEEILDERGQISTTCEFCNQTYTFDKVDIALLLSPQASKGPDQPQ